MKIIKTILIFFLSTCSYGQAAVEYVNSQENIDSGFPFSEAVIVDKIVYLSGKVGRLPSGELIKGGIEAETTQTLKNIESVLKRIDLTKEDIFKCTCMLVDIKDWPKMSKAYKSFFDRAAPIKPTAPVIKIFIFLKSILSNFLIQFQF